MSTQLGKLVAVLEYLGRGAEPVDGGYWVGSSS